MGTSIEATSQHMPKSCIGVIGLQGRMGQILAERLMAKQEAGELLFGGGATRDKDAYTGAFEHHIKDVSDLYMKNDCLIDFTSPDMLESNLNQAVQNSVPLVIGTTGLSNAQEEMIADAAKTIPIVYAANMSIGVNVMLDLVEKAAILLNEEYDIEIFEAHHKHKVDSPSGTALALGKAAALGRDVSFEDKAMSNMGNREGARQKGDIGFSVLRGGDIVGEHSVGFYSDYERFEIRHAAGHRGLFAEGAIKAALWLCAQKKAGLYNMRDVLGL